MPPIRKFNKEQIIELCLRLTKEEGFESLNARRIAKELHSSVQPIFHNFKSMEELKSIVYKHIYNLYEEYMIRDKDKERAYKWMGINYIAFARDYPEYFKLIFMQKTDLNAEAFIMSDKMGNKVIEKGQLLTGFSLEEQKKFHTKVWIFTHGIACLVATDTIQITNEEIDKLLDETVLELLVGYKKGKESCKK